MYKEFHDELDDLHNALIVYKRKEMILSNKVRYWCEQFIPENYEIEDIIFDRAICYVQVSRLFLGYFRFTQTYNLNQLTAKFKS